MGSETPDEDRERRLGGGLAYDADDLRGIFDWLGEVQLRRMRDLPPESGLFGEPFLWAGLFRRPGAPLPVVSPRDQPRHRSRLHAR